MLCRAALEFLPNDRFLICLDQDLIMIVALAGNTKDMVFSAPPFPLKKKAQNVILRQLS